MDGDSLLKVRIDSKWQSSLTTAYGRKFDLRLMRLLFDLTGMMLLNGFHLVDELSLQGRDAIFFDERNLLEN